MPLTEHTFIKLEANRFLALVIGIIVTVSSFWIGYGNLMQKLDRIEIAQKLQDDRIAKLEGDK